MTFRIEPVVCEDMDILFDVYLQAFSDDPISMHMYNDLPWDTKLQFESNGPKEVFLKQPWVKYHKIVEAESGKVVAWSRWHFPRPLKDEERGKMDPDYFDDIPTGANVSLCEEFFNKLEKIEFKYIDRENGFFINYLTVLPAYQRLGLGSKLLDIGLEEADKLGASVFLVATERGEGLYRKKGFLEVERFEIDMKPHGGELVIPFLGMTRGLTEARESGK